MRFGNLNIQIIQESTFCLDGGALFGVVPKTLWGQVAPPDQLNRTRLSCNLLLIESPEGRVLCDTGMGNRWNEKETDRFQLRSHVDHQCLLNDFQLSNEDIDFVILSHLHFDHAGGCVISKNGKLQPAFPRARHVVQKGEWEFARKANARARASYRPDDFEPLHAHGLLTLVEGNTEILPGISVQVSGGHTGHHQIVTWESQGLKGVYFADIMPTKNHVPPAWVMGYDCFPLTSCDVKTAWLERAALEDWLIVFDHEAGVPWGRVRKVANDKYQWLPLSAESLKWSGNV